MKVYPEGWLFPETLALVQTEQKGGMRELPVDSNDPGADRDSDGGDDVADMGGAG